MSKKRSEKSIERAKALVAAGLYGGGAWVDEDETSVASFSIITADIAAAIDEAVREEREAMLAFGKRAVSDTDSRFDAPAEGERGHREYMRGWRRAWQSFEAAIRARGVRDEQKAGIR